MPVKVLPKVEGEPLAECEAKRALDLRAMRDRNRTARAKLPEAGIVPLTLEIPQHKIDELDALKQRAGLRNRSQVFIRKMPVLPANPQLKQELGL